MLSYEPLLLYVIISLKASIHCHWFEKKNQ